MTQDVIQSVRSFAARVRKQRRVTKLLCYDESRASSARRKSTVSRACK